MGRGRGNTLVLGRDRASRASSRSAASTRSAWCSTTADSGLYSWIPARTRPGIATGCGHGTWNASGRRRILVRPAGAVRPADTMAPFPRPRHDRPDEKKTTHFGYQDVPWSEGASRARRVRLGRAQVRPDERPDVGRHAPSAVEAVHAVADPVAPSPARSTSPVAPATRPWHGPPAIHDWWCSATSTAPCSASVATGCVDAGLVSRHRLRAGQRGSCRSPTARSTA